jgi:hypothetical protein
MAAPIPKRPSPPPGAFVTRLQTPDDPRAILHIRLVSPGVQAEGEQRSVFHAQGEGDGYGYA